MVRGLDNLIFFVLAYQFGELYSAILSRNKAVKSSSIFDHGIWVPSRAVDGNYDTDADGLCDCCFATLNELNPWFELDLGKSRKIHRIDFIGRNNWDFYDQSFQNMKIIFTQLSVNGFTNSPETTITERVGKITYVLPEQKYTRYISLVLRSVTRHLTICELTVYGDCEDGEYGDYCEKSCHFCDGDPCDKVTGICPSGKCLPGYSGEKCDTECQGGTYGSGCTEQCGYCFNNVDCHKTNGNCPGKCSAGYKGAICKQECNTYYYGQYCLSKCGSCINGETCNHVTGVCTNSCADGYINQKCDQPCSPGYYGKNCQAGCGHCRLGTVCYHTDGTCPSGCSSGFQGDLCTAECDDSFYGNECQSKCGFCTNGIDCNKVSGECEQGCIPGYIGLYCNQSCSDSFYGNKCESQCGYCKYDTICNKINGDCKTGCIAGYKGQLCLEECEDGSYGENCVHHCGRCYNDTVCDKRSGKCNGCNGCAAGFKGDNCDVEDSPSGIASYSVSTGVAIGGTAGTILLIEAFVGAVIYLIWKRRQGQSDRRSPEEVNPYEMPDRKAFTSEHHYELNQRSVTTTPTYENTQRPQNNE